MSECIHGLNRFLARAKAKSKPGLGVPCHVVIGNEAADLDSMTSAIMYGFFASNQPSREENVHVPVVNIPRRDFILRTEAAYLFDALGIDVAALLFIDEIDLDAPRRNSGLKLTLVDHNVLSNAQARYANAVEAIIDHHDDSGLYPQVGLRMIEPVGSAATLVAEMILRDAPALVDEGTATLLLGTILLDTVNLSPDAKRVTPKDRKLAARLCEVQHGDPSALFEALQSAKFDVSGLRTGDLLRKDYKEWDVGSTRYGISTVLTSLANWTARDPDIVEGMDAYLRSRDLQCLIVMMAYTDANDAFRREIAVLAPATAVREGLAALLSTSVKGLCPIHPRLKHSDKVDFFNQEDLSLSRKKLQPILHRFFTGLKPDEKYPDPH